MPYSPSHTNKSWLFISFSFASSHQITVRIRMNPMISGNRRRGNIRWCPPLFGANLGTSNVLLSSHFDSANHTASRYIPPAPRPCPIDSFWRRPLMHPPPQTPPKQHRRPLPSLLLLLLGPTNTALLKIRGKYLGGLKNILSIKSSRLLQIKQASPRWRGARQLDTRNGDGLAALSLSRSVDWGKTTRVRVTPQFPIPRTPYSVLFCQYSRGARDRSRGAAWIWMRKAKWVGGWVCCFPLFSGGGDPLYE